jgi:diaminopimelate epimerase
MSETLTFWKMNGAGNDFVVIDNRDLAHNLDRNQIAALCDRHRGVGADGLLAVEPAESGADSRMRYYNADGGEAEMCGNGARCFGNFLRFLRGGGDAPVSFETPAGLIGASFDGPNVRLSMSKPFDLRKGLSLDGPQGVMIVHHVNTGVPHAVIVVDDLAGVNVPLLGRAYRFHDAFAPKGANVNFCQVTGPSQIAIRTYERGVEDETLACGTGMVACAIIHHLLTGDPAPVSVTVKGGDTLVIGFQAEGDSFSEVTLCGPADLVFSGQITIPS